MPPRSTARLGEHLLARQTVEGQDGPVSSGLNAEREGYVSSTPRCRQIARFRSAIPGGKTRPPRVGPPAQQESIVANLHSGSQQRVLRERRVGTRLSQERQRAVGGALRQGRWPSVGGVH
jgi:hypothetical protein